MFGNRRVNSPASSRLVAVKVQILANADVAAGVDLCLHMLATDHGATAAAEAAQSMVTRCYYPGEQAQVTHQSIPRRGDDLAGSREWAISRIDQPITVSQLAARLAEARLLRRLEHLPDEVVTDAKAGAAHNGAAESAAEEPLQRAAGAHAPCTLFVLGLHGGCGGLDVVVDHRVDGLQQQRGLPFLLLHPQRYLLQIERPFAGVGVTRGSGGLQLAGQCLDQGRRVLTLLL
jgi:hypothetical protein